MKCRKKIIMKIECNTKGSKCHREIENFVVVSAFHVLILCLQFNLSHSIRCSFFSQLWRSMQSWKNLLPSRKSTSNILWGTRQVWQRQRQMKLLKPHYNGAEKTAKRQWETDGNEDGWWAMAGRSKSWQKWQCNSSNVKMHSENQQPKIVGINQNTTIGQESRKSWRQHLAELFKCQNFKRSSHFVEQFFKN